MAHFHLKFLKTQFLFLVIGARYAQIGSVLKRDLHIGVFNLLHQVVMSLVRWNQAFSKGIAFNQNSIICFYRSSKYNPRCSMQSSL